MIDIVLIQELYILFSQNIEKVKCFHHVENNMNITKQLAISIYSIVLQNGAPAGLIKNMKVIISQKAI